MLTPQEQDEIRLAYSKASDMINNMIQTIDSISNKTEEINSFIDSLISVHAGRAQNELKLWPTLKSRLNAIKENLEPLNNIGSGGTDAFKKFLIPEFVSYPWLHRANLSQYDSETGFIAFLSDNKEINSATRHKIPVVLNNFYSHYKEITVQLENKISTLNIFDKIKDIHGNIVMIGANGSGKSSFARTLKGTMVTGSINIFSSQRLLIYSPSQSISASDDEIKKVHAHQENSKLSSDSQLRNNIHNDINQLVSALIGQYTKCAHDLYKTNIRETSDLDKTITIWSKLIEHRSIEVGETKLSAKTKTPEDPIYPFNDMSDGEKAVFYYIGHVLLSKEESYIIVDEPENHLHPAVCNKLWDKLEAARSDCTFIYLTHNLDFAMSRTNSTTLWNKSFAPPDVWEFEILPSDDVIPDSLMMELVGSRKSICFCEGDDKGSIDYKLYSILFPNYTIIPVDGHGSVIAYTMAYNKSPLFSHQKAVGIIDGDCHLPEQIEKWKLNHVTTLPANEVENILCDELILDAVIERVLLKNEVKDTFMELFWKELKKDKEAQATWHVNNYINNKFKKNCLKQEQDINELQKELDELTSHAEVYQKYDSRLQHIIKLIENKDYNNAVKIVNWKKKLSRGLANKAFGCDYEGKTLNLLKKDPALYELLRDKYFPGFYQYES